LYQQQRQYDQALAALQKALSINRELGDRSSEQSTLTSGHYILISEDSILIRIGEIYEQQGQYEQALQSYQQALTLNRQLVIALVQATLMS
jgi:tetratricopeptide (TPR) repeat protein